MDSQSVYIQDYGLQYRGEIVTNIEVDQEYEEIRGWDFSILVNKAVRNDYYVTTIRPDPHMWRDAETKHHVPEAEAMALINEVYRIEQERRRQREQDIMIGEANIIKRPPKELVLKIAKAFDIPPEMLGVDSPRVINRKETLGGLSNGTHD